MANNAIPENAGLGITQLKNTVTENAAPQKSICDIHAAIENMGNNLTLFIKHFNSFKTSNADLAFRLTSLINEERYTEAGMLALNSLYRHSSGLEQMLCGENPVKPKDAHEAIFNIGNDIRLICQLQL